MNNQTKSGYKAKNLKMQDVSSIIWEFNGVLNPRRGYKPLTRLAGERLQPLGHLSKLKYLMLKLPWFTFTSKMALHLFKLYLPSDYITFIVTSYAANTQDSELSLAGSKY